VTIVAMTASAMTGDRDLCLQAGMDDYIDKPLERARLAQLLDQWAEKMRVSATPAAPAAPAAPPPSGVPAPLIDRPKLEKLVAERGAEQTREQADRLLADLQSHLADVAAAIKSQDFAPLIAKGNGLDQAALDLGFARLAQILGDLDRGIMGKSVAEEMVAAAGQVGRKSAELARLMLQP